MITRLMGISGNVNVDKLAKDYEKLLAPEEHIHAGFQVVRDLIIFTSNRIIMIDVQGMTGRKREYLTIPYGKIAKFSIESSGHLDLEADLKIWVGSDPVPIEKKFNRKTNIYDVQRIMATFL